MALDYSLLEQVKPSNMLANQLKLQQQQQELDQSAQTFPLVRQQRQQALQEGQQGLDEGQIKLAREKIDGALGLAMNSRDQASYEINRQKAAQMGLDISTLPEQFDPDQIKSMQYNLLSARDKLDMQLKQQMLDSGRYLPAPVQLANAIQSARNNGDTQRLTDLGLTGKLFDKGISYGGGGVTPLSTGSGPTTPMPQAPSNGSVDTQGIANALDNLPMAATDTAPITTPARPTLPAPSGNYDDLLATRAGKAQDAKNQSDLTFKPTIAGQEEGAKEKAKFAAGRENQTPAAQATLRSALENSKNVTDTIDTVLPKVTSLTTGVVGSLTKDIPGSPAYDLAQQLMTIKANLGFDKLQEMRNNSPTGGALGQVSDVEGKLLQSAWASVEQSQSPGQLLDNLNKVKKLKSDSNQRLKDAFETDYGRYSDVNSIPKVGTPNISTSATNTDGGWSIRRIP